MKKNFLAMTALAAMLFAGCTSSDELTTLESIKQAENAPTPISFGTYMGRTTTRATGGAIGNIITDATLQSRGFGVFAYYTGTKTYDQTQYYDGGTIADGNKLVPNFMWNQSVTYSGGWTYSPVKYWPNEIQNADVDQQTPAAQGGSNYGGKLSFFAYAPYLASTSADDGIIGISQKGDKGDPKITYKVGAIANFVDLLWGTKGSTATSVISGGDAGNTGVDDNADGQKHYTEALLTGKVTNSDLTKQELDGNVEFAFKHALAKFGGYEGLEIKVDADAITDGTLAQTVDGSGNATDGTKVTVKSITINAKAKNSDASAYYTDQAGTFNLATGEWNITSSTGTPAAEWTYTISGDKLNTAIKDVAGNWGAQPNGVRVAAQKVYSSASVEEPIIFIPGTRPELTVTVDYMVRTKDDNLELGYSEVEQIITRTITFGSVVDLNKYYKLLIRLGLTEINFNATVSAWDDASGGGAGTEINLPLNVN